MSGMVKSFQREGLVAPVRDVLAGAARDVYTCLRGERLCFDVIHNSTLLECLAECLSYVEDRGELLSLSDNRVQPVRGLDWIGRWVSVPPLFFCSFDSGEQWSNELRCALLPSEGR